MTHGDTPILMPLSIIAGVKEGIMRRLLRHIMIGQVQEAQKTKARETTTPRSLLAPHYLEVRLVVCEAIAQAQRRRC